MFAIDVAVLAALAVGAGTVAVVVWTFGRLRAYDSVATEANSPADGKIGFELIMDMRSYR
jgi:hypothetical protein